MNKLNKTLSSKELYDAPKCEMHEIVPEGTICQPVSCYDEDDINDNGGWI